MYVQKCKDFLCDGREGDRNEKTRRSSKPCRGASLPSLGCHRSPERGSKNDPPTINIKRRLKNRRSPPPHLKETHAATGDARGAGAGPRRGPAAFLPTASRGHPSVVPSPVSAAGTDAPPFGGDAAGASTARE